MSMYIKNNTKPAFFKVIFIVIILSADLNKSLKVKNIGFIISLLISLFYLLNNFINNNKIIVFKKELPIYLSSIVLSMTILIFMKNFINLAHIVKVLIIFLIILPIMRRNFSESELMYSLKITVLLNFIFIVLGYIGFDFFSSITGINRGSTVLNYAGSLYKVGLVSLPYLIYDTIKVKFKLSNIILILISTYIIFFDGSRTGILALFMMLILFLIMYISNLFNSKKISKTSIIYTFFFLVSILTTVIMNVDKIINTNAFIRLQDFMSIVFSFNINDILLKGDTVRGIMIKTSILEIKKNGLFLGNGLENTLVNGIVIHNAYLQIWADLGIIGLFSFMFILVYPLRLAKKT